MTLSVTRFSWWYMKGKEKEPVSNGSSSLNSSTDWGLGLRDASKDSMKLFPPAMKKGARISSSSRKVKKKWTSREERRIDKEFDLVLVPSDGVCLSGSDTDDSDWSTGWLEPHAPDFQNEDEADDSFAVLVPCYRNDYKGVKEETNKHQHFGVINNLLDDYSSDGNTYMEQWLTSNQNF